MPRVKIHRRVIATKFQRFQALEYAPNFGPAGFLKAKTGDDGALILYHPAPWDDSIGKEIADGDYIYTNSKGDSCVMHKEAFRYGISNGLFELDPDTAELVVPEQVCEASLWNRHGDYPEVTLETPATKCRDVWIGCCGRPKEDHGVYASEWPKGGLGRDSHVMQMDFRRVCPGSMLYRCNRGKLHHLSAYHVRNGGDFFTILPE